MPTTTPRERFLRFGNFRLDGRTTELFLDGQPVRLPPQPAKLLLLLVSSKGELVTHEEIQKALWGDDTFIDFEQGIHKCIKQVRAALADEAEEPVYIETVPRRGYRFVAKVEVEAAEQRSRRPFAAIAVLVGVLAMGALAAWFVRLKARPVDARIPRFQLTLPRGVSIPGHRRARHPSRDLSGGR